MWLRRVALACGDGGSVGRVGGLRLRGAVARLSVTSRVGTKASSSDAEQKKAWKADAIRQQMAQHATDTSSMTVVQGKPGVCVLGRPVGPLAMNQYLVFCEDTKEAAIVDSGTDTMPDFLDIIKNEQLDVKYLLQTHAHPDHVAGLAVTKRQFPAAKVVMHEKELPVAAAAPQFGQAFGLSIEPLPEPDLLLDDNATITIGNLTFRALHTPGHCPGHLCFYEEEKGILFSGDLLFKGTVGRTDLPGSAQADMKASLQRLVEVVRSSDIDESDTHIFPGHMEPTTMRFELRVNPFLQMMKRAARKQ
ncbi:hypothetical protein PTSG_06922 [Salpingoeca rosetta]|uniref:Metallo-beta-lactamase domain-containing protein n=1 Tax=Salpingoeca rosetta (strain ATCC 50818 / BSB-021) TaxID=946362 RepID=F2UF69_SALR5|nr:uncharacterized protein PTSG_06922 [Salpingoeca rosetta]EGD75269.1 hypothetical protein PTSG_06922 [Salpingoeca rosetta]|eukprot:XP_004992322.1 hypothetical protein PTSG_06922 [Salpingoeca rosetta]